MIEICSRASLKCATLKYFVISDRLSHIYQELLYIILPRFIVMSGTKYYQRKYAICKELPYFHNRPIQCKKTFAFSV
jgi:hypothetical protein